MTVEKVTPITAARARAAIGDLAHAKQFVALHGEQIRYIEEWGTWLVWDKVRWNTAGNVHFLAAQASTAMPKVTTLARIQAFVTIASWAPAIRLSHRDLDRDGMALACPNGTVDLETGTLGPPKPRAMLTKLAGCRFDPKAKAPRWDRFLRESVPDAETRDWLQRWAGYCATGDVSERMFAILYGPGRNGKGVFLQMLQAALGEYATTTAPGLLMAHKNEQHSTGITDLFHKRLAVAQEVKVGSTFDEELVKRITGDDELTARRMRQDNWSFRPTHKLILAANEQPTVRDATESFWDRIALVPFDVRVEDAKVDRGLRDKLSEELPGILAWVVRGCLEWQRRGLKRSKAITAAGEAYRVSEDILGQFFDGRCAFRRGATANLPSLLSAYELWADVNSARRTTAKAMALALKRRGLVQRHTKTGNFWDGIEVVKR